MLGSSQLPVTIKKEPKSVHNLRAMVLTDTAYGIVIVYWPTKGGSDFTHQ